MKYFDNHFLFSETYIKEYIKEENKKKGQVNNVLESAFKVVKDWNNEYVSGEYSNDPWANYIDVVLDALGFQKTIMNQDRLLYTNTINENEKPVAVCHVINKEENVSSTRKGKYYAYNAINAAKKYGVSWAMLTNGYQWRIYNTKNVSPYENYLEVDIEESIRNNRQVNDAFKLFYLFFNARTYYINNEELEIERIKELSDAKAETIEETLRGKSEEILKELCYGFKEDIGKDRYTEEEKKGIYNDAIILLYRLLFFGYAESRGLLPIKENDPEYTDSYKKLCEDAKNLHNEGEVYKIKDGFEFWLRLDSQLRLYVDRSYNGGLFHNLDKHILKEHRISNGRLTKCLAELSYNHDKNGKYSEAIEYKDLSVRNLGSIYEGLLEYRLFIADERMVQKKSKGQVKYLRAAEVKLQNSDLKNIIEKGEIYLSQDALERKETGAYYTPEDVVEYIVDNTVGKKLEDLKEELRESLNDLFEQLNYEPVVSRKKMLQNQIDEFTMQFIHEKILGLSIIDSAMGSGHFLVNAAYRVANEIVEMLAENDWVSDEDIVTDIKYWKRKVVENCIYGIDINGLSVALARLSLWLISASNDKALSFIDHHLKEGNSIIGTDRKHVEVKGSKDQLFGVLSYEQYMRPILEKYTELKIVGSATKADVLRQQEIYEGINEDLKIAKKKYDYYLASQYAGGIEEQIKYYNLLSSNKMCDFEREEMESLWKVARENKFFHWELEFPEVFLHGGFDITIGNPPYVEAESNNYIGVKITNNCHNLYAFMIETSFRKMKSKGYFGMILPTACLSTPRMSSLQKLLIDNSARIYFSTYDDRPAKIFLRLESMRVAIITAEVQLGKEKLHEVYTTKYNRWYSEERKSLFKNLHFVKLTKHDYLEGYIPKVGSKYEDSIFSKLFSKEKTIGHYVDNGNTKNGLHYGYGVRYWIKGMDKSAEEIDTIQRKSTGDKRLYFCDKYSNKVFTSLVNSSTFFLYFTSFSDARNLTKNTITSFPFEYEKLTKEQTELLIELTDRLMKDYISNSVLKTCSYVSTGNITYREYYPKKSKQIIDQIDDVLSDYYDFSVDELNYIKNFESRFRMGKDWEDDPDEL